MKTIIAFTCLFLLKFGCIGQQLTLNNLIQFCNNSPEEINNILERKDWFYQGTKEYEGQSFIQFEEPVIQITWSFNLNNAQDNSRWTHQLIYYEYFEIKEGKEYNEQLNLKDVEIRRRVTLFTYIKTDYNNIINQIEERFVKTDDKLLKDAVVKMYESIDNWFLIGYTNNQPPIYICEIRSRNEK